MNNYQHALYEVTISLYKLYLAITFKCDVTVSVKRGHKKYSLPKAFPLDTSKFKCDFEGATITYQVVFSRDAGTGTYLSEKTVASVILVTSKGPKNAGHFEFNPPGLIGVSGSDAPVKVLVEKCPDKKATVSYAVGLKKIRDLSEEEYR